MTLSELYTILASTGLPVAYNAFPETDAPDLPVITYNVAYTRNFAAGDQVYQAIKHIDIHLYTKTKDESTEALVESALNDAFLVWNYTEAFEDAEECYHLIYEVEIYG